MKPIYAPKEIDLDIQSSPWTEDELRDFRALMQAIKDKAKKSTPRKRKSLKQLAG